VLTVGPKDIAAVKAATAKYAAEATDPRAAVVAIFASIPQIVSGAYFIHAAKVLTFPPDI
jgi:hypothetical protein